MIRSPFAGIMVSEQLLEAVGQVLLPILHEQVNEGQNRSLHNGGDTVSLELSMETIGFLANLFKILDPIQLSKLANRSRCVEILTDFSFFVFSSETSLTRSHLLRQHCLHCILSYASLPALISSVGSENISHLIRLLVQIIGSFQKSFSNFADGNSFTYKDSCAYKWTALCLRNLSRTVIVIESPNAWIWGNHWLYENDIDWLLNFLNDDEKIVQKFGLGILANLILL